MKTPWVAAAVMAAMALSGCDKPEAKKAAAPAKTELLAHESELLKLTLTPQAVQRLGIATAPVAAGDAPMTRTYPGEVTAPATAPGGYGQITPTAPGDLASLAQSQIAAEGQVRVARARLEAARTELARAQRLLDQDAGSVLERDRAREQVRLAEAALSTAQAGRAVLGQSVANAGSLPTVWVRTPVYVGDLSSISRSATAAVGDPSGRSDLPKKPGRPVPGATASAAASSVDLYYAVDNRDRTLRIGQRVGVQVPLNGRADGKLIPWSAVLHDIHGGEWVYEQTAPTVFVRRRIQVASVAGDVAVLASGPAVGAKVVTQGAAELFGTEFGAK